MDLDGTIGYGWLDEKGNGRFSSWQEHLRQVKDEEPGSRFQFERNGYFVIDIVDSTKEKLVLNRIITLRDSWAKK